MKPQNQSYYTLYQVVLITLLHFQACSTCSIAPNTHSQDDNQPTSPQNNERPIPLGHVTLSNYNQQNHPAARENHAVGNGSCTCIVGTLLKETQKNPQLSLHQDSSKLDTILGEGIQLYVKSFPANAANSESTRIEDVLQKLQLEQDESTLDPNFLQPNMLTTKDAIFQELGRFNNSKKLAVIKAGPEAWGLISYGDGTFDLFDPHGRTDLNKGNSAAFIKRTNQGWISEHIWTHYPFKDYTADEIDGLTEDEKQNGFVYIFWLK